MASGAPPSHPILDIDQARTLDTANVAYWSNLLRQKDQEKHDLQVSLWAVCAFAAVLLIAVVVLAFGRREVHYRDVTDALGNTYQFGIRSVDAHDQEAVRLTLERYIKGVRLVTRDANYQYRETNVAYHMSRIKAQNAISEHFQREGKPEDLNSRDISRNVVEGSLQIAFQTGNTFTARWIEEKKDPTLGNTSSQWAGSGVLELKDPATLSGQERTASPLGIFVSEFSFNEMK
jgi:type IV secretory pathway TrbF-like protein